jgi:hypothetical protein
MREPDKPQEVANVKAHSCSAWTYWNTLHKIEEVDFNPNMWENGNVRVCKTCAYLGEHEE